MNIYFLLRLKSSGITLGTDLLDPRWARMMGVAADQKSDARSNSSSRALGRTWTRMV